MLVRHAVTPERRQCLSVDRVGPAGPNGASLTAWHGMARHGMAWQSSGRQGLWSDNMWSDNIRKIAES